MEVDLNCDLGEGGAFDAELMPLITSANVACGFHAGDPATAFATLALAVRHGVQVGAHPSFNDRASFGRRDREQPHRQTFEECIYQIGALAALAEAAARAEGKSLALAYVKPHGALYNMACRDSRVALPVIEAACQFGLPVLGLPACAWRGPATASAASSPRALPTAATCPMVRGAARPRRRLRGGRRRGRASGRMAAARERCQNPLRPRRQPPGRRIRRRPPRRVRREEHCHQKVFLRDTLDSDAGIGLFPLRLPMVYR